MFNKVQKDLLKKHTGPFLFCFFTVMFVLLMQFLILHVDKLVGKGLPLSIVIELILNNLAYMVVLAIPMAVLVATLMAFGKFSEWNELTALKAAGVNPISLMKPVLLTAFLLFIGLSYFSNQILPESNHKARSLFIDIRMQKPGFDLQQGVFYEGIEGYTFLVKNIPSASDTLYDVTLIQEPTSDRYRAYIKAEKGWLVSPDEFTLSLFLEDGTIIRYIPGSRQGMETVEKSHFNQYRISFDLSDLAFSRSNPEQRTRNDRTMSSQAMLAVIDTLRNEKEQEFKKYMDGIGTLRAESPSQSRDYSGTSFYESDTLQIYESKYETLNELIDVNNQSRVVTHAISRLSSYRSEIDNLAKNLKWREIRIAEYMVEVHKKFSIPFACIIFVLLGAPIGMMTRKGNIGIAAIISSVLLTFYFIAIIQGEKWADRLFISPVVGMWGINIFLAIVGMVLIFKISASFKFEHLTGKG